MGLDERRALVAQAVRTLAGGEILTLTVDIKRLLVSEPDLTKLTEGAYRAGMRPLRLSGLMKVAQGVTTIEEVLKVAPV